MQQNMNELGLYDIYGPWHVPFWQTNAFYGVMACVILLLAGLVCWYLIKRYRARKPALSCWERALSDLQQLDKDTMIREDLGKEFYGALTRVLKRYMHERYGLEGTEKTDDEFLKYLKKKEFSSDFLQEIQSIFEGSVVIKFANMSAARQQMERDLFNAIAFIKKTIPQSQK